ncbi:polyphenol oxidase family protein [Tatumella ptyseos]|nr:polyphenol oxidase family protein [Tatumella ptyseos]
MSLPSSAAQQSPLLLSLGWVRHGFLPAGQRPPDNTAYALQRHTDTVCPADSNFPPKQSVADALFSHHGQPVAIYTADCLPVLIASEKTHQVAAAHAGLKGTLAGILQQTLSRFFAEGSAASDLYIAIGPAIGPCCYELGLPLFEEIKACRYVRDPIPGAFHPAVNPLARRPTAPVTQPAFWLDLPALATQMLLQEGIAASRIDNLNQCTYCMAEPGASYRRNTHTDEGYQLRFSWIAGEPSVPLPGAD